MLKIIFKIALRNVLRRKLQTSLLGFMIFFTTFVIFALVGVQTGAFRLIEDSYTKVFNGDLQIRSIDYKDVEDFEKMIEESDLASIKNTLSKYSKTEVFTSERYISFALGDFNNKNYSFQLVGINPETEKNLSMPSTHMKSGVYLDDNSYNDIIIGQDLADYFSLSVGDEIVLMSSDIYESFVIDSFRIKGIYEVGDIMLDKNTGFIHKKYFDDNIVYGKKATNLTIRLSDSSYRGNLKELIAKNISPKFQVLSWDEILPEIKQTIEFQFTVSMFFYVLLVAIVSFILINSMMLATIKRLPEFGIYSSIGLNNRYFKWILFFENFILASFFIGLGSILGMFFVYYFSIQGIPLPAMTESKDQPLTLLSNVLYPNPKDSLLWVGPLLIYVACIFSIIPPTIRLLKSNPVQSITSN